MKKLTNFRMDVWTDGNEKKVSFHADIHSADGPKNFIFYFTQEDTFKDFCTGRTDSFMDLSYNLKCGGDSLVYYIFELPNRESGKAQIPFAHIHFPIRFRKILLRLVQGLWAKHFEQCRVSPSRVAPKLTVLIDDERLARMEKSYSSGSGDVHVSEDFPSKVSQEEWEAMKLAEPDLIKNMRRVVAIAENTTRSYLQTAKAHFRLTYCESCVDYSVTARLKNPIDGTYNERTITYGTIAKRDPADDGKGHRWSMHS